VPSRRKPPTLTANQLVALNLRRARNLRELTQEEAAERLEPYLGVRWSKATFSAAERSAAERTRGREFSADELLAFALAFDVSLAFFFFPPEEEAALPVVSCGGPRTVGAGELLEATLDHGFGKGVGPRLKKLVERLPNDLDVKIRRLAWQRARANVVAAIGPIGEKAAELRHVAEALENVERNTSAGIAKALGVPAYDKKEDDDD
jgi:transcriptional regulator with XRE-family HTH domain